MTPDALANVLGALSQAIADEVDAAVSGAAERVASDAAALIHLSKYPGEPIDSLRAPLRLSHPGCVRVVDRLERERLLVREKGEDKRARAVALTPKGEAEARAAHRQRLAKLRAALAVLSARERESLAALASKLLAELVRDESQAAAVCRLCDYRICPDDTCPVALALAE